MSKQFQHGGPYVASTPKQPTETNWDLCVLCQEETAESLTCPAQSKRRDAGRGYTTLAQNLVRFNELGKLPRHVQLDRIDEGQGLEAAMVAHEAKWHQRCVLHYKTTMLRRAEKRAKPTSPTSDTVSSKRMISHSSTKESSKETCFFCGELGTDSLHRASTLQMDKNVRESAALVGNNELLARLSMGDMVALEAKYHTKCLTSLYNHARKVKGHAEQATDCEHELAGIAFAELVMYIEETRMETGTAPVFKLIDLANLYKSRLEQLGIVHDKRVNTTRLKERLLAQIPDMLSYTKGRDVLLAFDEDVGAELGKACDWDSDSDAMYLARAAQIVRRHMFENERLFDGSFKMRCQEKSVPNLLLALVNMVLKGPSIKNQSCTSTSPGALSIAQLLKFNAVKHKQKLQETSSGTSSETSSAVSQGIM